MNKTYKLSVLVVAFSLCGNFAFAQNIPAPVQSPSTGGQAVAPGSGDQCPGGHGGGPGGPGGGFGGPGGPAPSN